ncbi:MAG: ABC transporter permease [Fimbriimonadaceae bacterium]|nr:ABC transporter permease [Fimbriimonadaceae bacterium]
MHAVFAIARTTIGEAIRRRVLLVILLIALLLLVVAPGMNVLTARQSQTVLTSLILGVLQLSSAVIAIVLTVYMLPNEVERRTIYTILSKPVLRWQFLLGKYLGAVGALGLMMAMMTGTMILVFALVQRGASTDLLTGLARVPIMFFVQMCLLAAVAVFFSTFVQPVVNFFLSGGVYLVGTVFGSLFSTISENQNLPMVAKIGSNLIMWLVPNFAQYNVQNSVINQGSVIVSEQVYYAQMVIYGIVYISILLLAGMLIFDRREV